MFLGCDQTKQISVAIKNKERPTWQQNIKIGVSSVVQHLYWLNSSFIGSPSNNGELYTSLHYSRFFKGVLGTGFRSLELKIGSLESSKIVIGPLESEEIGSV